MVKFLCGKCGYSKDVSDKYLNKRVRCPKCQEPVLVSGAAAATQEPAPKAAAAAPAAAATDVLRFACPSCGLKIKVKSEYAGKRVRCAKCKNPMTVPGGKKAVPKPKAGDAASVLRAGNEDAGSDDPGGDAFSNMDALLGMEQNSEALERPVAERVDDPEDEEQSEDFSQVARPRRGKSKSGGSSEIGKAFIIGGGIAAVYVGLIIALVMSFPKDGGSVKEEGFDYADVEEFGTEYVALMAEGKVEEAKEMMHSDLAVDSWKHDLDKIVTFTSDGGPFVLDHTYKSVLPGSGREGFSLGYKSETAEYSMLTVVVQSTEEGFVVQGMSTMDESWNGTQMFTGLGKKLNSEAQMQPFTEMAEFAFSVMIIIFIMIGVTFLIMVISMYVVFQKAGEPGWAAIVPAYNLWVLAEVAEKPGWWGLIIFFSNFIPFGGIVALVLSLIIAVGVSKTFEKGILFGLGLWLVPIIFYPILAFTGDKFQGMEAIY